MGIYGELKEALIRKVCYLGLISHPLIQRFANFFAAREWRVVTVGDVVPTQKYRLNPRVKEYVFPHYRHFRRLSLIKKIHLVRRVLNKERPSILHVHSLALYGKYVPFLRFKPTVITAWSLHGSMNLDKVRYLLQKAAVRESKMVTTGSNYEKTVLERIFGERNKFLSFPFGIDLSIFNAGLRKQAKKIRDALNIDVSSPVIIHTRLMWPFYRAHRIVLSLPGIIKDFPNATFIFLQGVPEPDYLRKMRRLVERLGVKQNVRFVEKFLAPHEVALYLNASDIFVSIPYDDGPCASILEGLACGLIPVLSDLPGYRELIGDGENGFLLKSSQPEEIAQILSYCIQNLRELRERVSSININIVNQRGNFTKQAEEMGNIYLKLIE